MEKKTFEENIKELEEIIQDFENNSNLDLDLSIEKYSKALELIKNAEKLLSEAEGKITILKQEEKIEE